MRMELNLKQLVHTDGQIVDVRKSSLDIVAFEGRTAESNSRRDGRLQLPLTSRLEDVVDYVHRGNHVGDGADGIARKIEGCFLEDLSQYKQTVSLESGEHAPRVHIPGPQ